MVIYKQMSKRTRLLSKLKHVYSHNTKLVLDVSNDDIGLIIEALEIKDEIKKKHRAKKTKVRKHYGMEVFDCPTCETTFFANRVNYCNECGQKLEIDWSATDENKEDN